MSLGPALKEYNPTPPAIKVSLGLSRSIVQNQAGELLSNPGGPEDLNSMIMWTSRGLPTDGLELWRLNHSYLNFPLEIPSKRPAVHILGCLPLLTLTCDDK